MSEGLGQVLPTRYLEDQVQWVENGKAEQGLLGGGNNMNSGPAAFWL